MTSNEANKLITYIDMLEAVSSDQQDASPEVELDSSNSLAGLRTLIETLINDRCERCVHEHLAFVIFDTWSINSDGKGIPGTSRKHILMYNNLVISRAEVEKLINSDMYEFDPRVVELSLKQLQNLRKH